MLIADAFALVSHAFPQVARFEGKHFQYAEKNGVVLIERKRTIREETRYYYWLLVGGRFRLIHRSQNSKLSPMRTIGDSLSPGEACEEE